MLEHTGYSAGEIAQFQAAYGRDAAIRPPSEVAAIIAAGGFDAPVLFFQSLLVHAWYTQKSG